MDDTDDVRLLLRLTLSQDERFEVVGEARDGYEAVEMCGRLAPDLVILDRQMPNMGGIEAMPLIKSRSPWTQIILYSAAVTPGMRESAAAAGAVGVLDKSGATQSIAEELTQLLVSRGAPLADAVEVKVGPVASGAARAWIANTRSLLTAIGHAPEAIGGPIAGPVLATFERFLDAWETVARDSDYFFWSGRAERQEVRALIEEWTRIDSMDDDTMAALGCRWAPPEARPFFESLTAAIIGALSEDDGARQQAELLGRGTAPRAS